MKAIQMKKIKKLEKKYEKYLTQQEKKILNNYVKGYKDIDKEIARIYKNYADNDGKLYMESMMKYSRLDKLERDVAKIIAAIYKENNTIINNTLRNIMETSYKETTNSLNVKAIIKPVTITEEVNKLVAGIKWRGRTNKYKSDLIYDAHGRIKKGLESGKTYAQMASDVEEIVGNDVMNPMRIARTEGHRIRESGKLHAARDIEAKGYELTKTWVTMKDERVRSSHQDMDGQTVGIDEEFTLPSGAKTQAPGMAGIAEEDINCRCILTYNIVRK